MMKISDPRFRRPLGSRVPLRGAGIAVVLVLLFAAAVLWRAPLGAAASRGMVPLNAARGGVSGLVNGFFSFFSSRAALEAENAELKTELAHVQSELADRDALAKENLALKAELGRPNAARGVILAGVIMRPPGTPYDTLLIDAGSGEGVKVGQVVSAGAGSAVGTVDEVFGGSARVALFSSPGTSYQGLLNGSVPLPIEGDGGGSFSGKVPAATPVTAGDPIVLPGIAGGFMGTVAGINAPEGDSFKTVYFRLPVNIFELQFVEVWK